LGNAHIEKAINLETETSKLAGPFGYGSIIPPHNTAVLRRIGSHAVHPHVATLLQKYKSAGVLTHGKA